MQLNLGPFSISTGKKQSYDMKMEYGSTGTAIYAGMLSETGEYLTDFKPGDQQKLIIEKMRRSDGQVKAGLLALTLPLLSAHWDIEPASKEGNDADIAEFIRQDLFNNMTCTWVDTLNHILLMLPFGFSVLEKVFEIRDDNMYHWRKLAPRLPKTIKRWYVDDEGGLAGIQQQTWKGSSYEQIEIPVEKLIVFTHEREGSNFEGISVLRAAYKHWYYKNTLYAIDGIAAERHGVGVAHFTFPATANDEQRKKIDEMGQRLHAHERAYIATPEGIGFDLKGVAGQLHDIKGSIEHHDLQILRSILAQFINLGAKAGGSYALSNDQSGFFLLALKSVAKNICDTFNNYAIKQLVDLNWAVDKYPKLVASDLDTLDVTTLSDAISKLAAAGAILLDDSIETELRRVLRLPVRVPGAPVRPQPQKPEQTAGQFSDPKVPTRELMPWEHFVNFKEIGNKLDAVKDEIVTAAQKVQAKQIKQIVRMAAEDVDAGNIKRVVNIDVPYREEMTKVLEEGLTKLYEFGMQQAQQEAQKQGAKVKATEGQPPDYASLIKARAIAMANILANKMRAALSWEALAQINAGTLDKSALTESLSALSDKDLVAAANLSTSEALNMGRQAEAEKLADQVTNIYSSAILDDETCEVCEARDGKTMDPDKDEEPPYTDCQGRDRCRCIWVYVYGNEEA